ncbi:MAG: hypothetical protein A2Y33_15410 [Spirochaetes bacterium GWF1_51_8]|nr:MAG: hypothetical protein A2Y33_15410 [Spirochaetes bacterium GWF1_51_8]
MIQRIPKQKKEAYNLVVKEYKERVDQTAKKADKFERESKALTGASQNYKKIIAGMTYLKTVGLYCEMNDKSVEIMNIKNDAYLGNARKNIYQAMKLLESIFGTDLDSTLTESSEIIQSLKQLNPKRILHLLQKMEYDITLVEYEEGGASKWKWNFVELYGKFAGLCKNMIDFKDYISRMYDPGKEYYSEVNEIIRLVKRVADTAAQKFRMKYELSSMVVGDMNRAIDYMNMLVKIYIILNEQPQAQEAKKAIEKWKEKLEQDLKKKEAEVKDQKKKAAIKKR